MLATSTSPPNFLLHILFQDSLEGKKVPLPYQDLLLALDPTSHDSTIITITNSPTKPLRCGFFCVKKLYVQLWLCTPFILASCACSRMARDTVGNRRAKAQESTSIAMGKIDRKMDDSLVVFHQPIWKICTSQIGFMGERWKFQKNT